MDNKNTIKPKWKTVSKKKFYKFIDNYPSTLKEHRTPAYHSYIDYSFCVDCNEFNKVVAQYDVEWEGYSKAKYKILKNWMEVKESLNKNSNISGAITLYAEVYDKDLKKHIIDLVHTSKIYVMNKTLVVELFNIKSIDPPYTMPIQDNIKFNSNKDAEDCLATIREALNFGKPNVIWYPNKYLK